MVDQFEVILMLNRSYFPTFFSMIHMIDRFEIMVEPSFDHHEWWTTRSDQSWCDPSARRCLINLPQLRGPLSPSFLGHLGTWYSNQYTNINIIPRLTWVNDITTLASWNTKSPSKTNTQGKKRIPIVVILCKIWWNILDYPCQGKPIN